MLYCTELAEHRRSVSEHSFKFQPALHSLHVWGLLLLTVYEYSSEDIFGWAEVWGAAGFHMNARIWVQTRLFEKEELLSSMLVG